MLKVIDNLKTRVDTRCYFCHGVHKVIGLASTLSEKIHIIHICDLCLQTLEDYVVNELGEE